MDRTPKDESSTSPQRPSPKSHPSPRGSRTSASPGNRSPRSGDRASRAGGLGGAALRALAERHGIRPSRSLGQNFLTDPNLAGRIATLANVGDGDRVVEVGAGLGSLTVALARTGARVLAIEFDRRVLAALEEVCAGIDSVEIRAADAMSIDWPAALVDGDWTMASNLPYNIATPMVLEMLERAPAIRHYLVMVQREVGERLTARPGDEGYGAVSVKVAYRAEAEILRRVPASVFWPAPKVESVLVRLLPYDVPPVTTDPRELFRIVGEGFAQRRKTMRNALRRLGLDAAEAGDAIERAGLGPRVRAEQIGLQGFVRLTDAVTRGGSHG